MENKVNDNILISSTSRILKDKLSECRNRKYSGGNSRGSKRNQFFDQLYLSTKLNSASVFQEVSQTLYNVLNVNLQPEPPYNLLGVNHRPG